MTDSLAIATQGFITSDEYRDNISLTIATQGFVVLVKERIVEEPIIPQGGGVHPFDRPTVEKKEKKKEITVTVIFPNGKRYTSTVELETITLSVSDVKVNEEDKTVSISLVSDEVEDMVIVRPLNESKRDSISVMVENVRLTVN